MPLVIGLDPVLDVAPSAGTLAPESDTDLRLVVARKDSAAPPEVDYGAAGDAPVEFATAWPPHR